MPLQTKLAEFVAKAGLKDDVAKWLETTGYVTYEDVALIADDLSGVTAGLHAVMVAADVPSSKEIIAAVNCKKLWRLCKDQNELDRKAPSSTAEVTGEMPIPQVEHQQITELWKTRHNMVLPDSQLLIPTHQGKMWRELNMVPPQLSTWLAETLRTRACLHKSTGTQLAVIPGQSVEAVEVVADAIEKAFELWSRIRAFFMTLAFACVKTPDWFPLQSAMQASDLILLKIMATYKGRTAPLQFLITAWAETSHWLSEQVRITQRSPASIIDNAGAWESRWAWNASTAGDAGGGGAVQQADNKVLRNQMQNLEKQVSMYKAQAVQAKQFANMQKQITMSRQSRREEAGEMEDDGHQRGGNRHRGNGAGKNRGGKGGNGAPWQGDGGADSSSKRAKPRKKRR